MEFAYIIGTLCGFLIVTDARHLIATLDDEGWGWRAGFQAFSVVLWITLITLLATGVF